jgi:hypothetical protein
MTTNNHSNNTHFNNQSLTEKKKEEPNYEKLYVNIIELKQEASITFKIFSDFFKNFISQNSSCSNTRELMQMISSLEENKKIINKSII